MRGAPEKRAGGARRLGEEQWTISPSDRRAEMRNSAKTPLGKRPSTFAEAPGTTSRDREPWWCASRSRSCSRQGLGGARCAAMSRTFQHRFKPTTTQALFLRRDDLEFLFSAPMGASTGRGSKLPGRARAWRAGAGSSIWIRSGHRHMFPFQGGRKFPDRNPHGKGFSFPRTMASVRRARASGCSTKRPTGARYLRRRWLYLRCGRLL